ncbi:hypothetical protein MA04_04144 [Alcanivorax balearicus MACL04]|uniref:Uncharacterized protein n=1 Tax=Alloalcanivorax balearicus MACL04 TaxID=1177182 RepID=A0ABT2R507_9GAMM|nr:hypothetical protein [Alloalcanivorax balearicus]MCU5784844.1 hypothetical protein [Alloalcanivorax balearicus MACL04]
MSKRTSKHRQRQLICTTTHDRDSGQTVVKVEGLFDGEPTFQVEKTFDDPVKACSCAVDYWVRVFL